jgi:hypothetical protein
MSMGKSLLQTKSKKKASRVTRSEAYLVNYKYLGDEPDANKFKKLSDQIKAYNWYNTMCTVSDAREYLKDYLTHNRETDLVKKIDKIPDAWVPLSTAWQVRIVMNQKAMLDLEPYVKFMKTLEEAFSHIKEEVATDKTKAEKPSIQDRIKERGYDIIGDVEEMIDSGDSFSLYDWLKKNEIPAMYASKIVDHYEPWLLELHEALGGDDSQLKEAYSYMNKKQLRDRVMFFETLVEDARKYGSVEKKKRANRKPKPVSVEKVLKNFKFQRESSEYRLASADPSKVIGSQELWTFNTKYKTLTVFRADGPKGLSVKGTSIIGYDENASQTMRTGRKPEDALDKVAKGGKIVLKKLVEELKNGLPLAHRINENTVILRVS